ncbi:MAG: zinc ABC transporter substrate-binding protein [Pseudomonadota bacterium]|nr:MAG: zinc ABC transporter substrate-binding protein [Pseudomonadota bacterium]
MKRLTYIVMLLLAVASTAARAELRVFACEPEWGALATELAPGANVFTATTARQDPHHIEARPSLIAQVRRADLVVCTGAELEDAWLPLLLRQAGNAKVQVGARGLFLATDWVSLRERPERLDRAEGDIHAAGNPHIHTDPRNIARVAQALSRRLADIDPAQAARYESARDDFVRRWQAAVGRWEQAARGLKGTNVISQHKGWVYLYDWLGLREIAVLEPKPGLPATIGHLTTVLERHKSERAAMVLHAAYQNPKPSRWLAERTGIPMIELPYTVGGSDGAKDLFGLFDDTLARLLAVPR